MFLKKGVFVLLCFCLFQNLKGQELAAVVSLQTNKVDNQVDPKIFVQLQTQLKDFINQRKWTADLFTQEEKIDCSFYITIESVVSPGVYNAKLSIVANRPVFRANYTTPLLNMQDANFTFKYQLGQPIEFNENNVARTDALEANLTATLAYYIYIILGLDYDSFSKNGGAPLFNKALNIVYNAPDGSGISGWKSYDGQRNRFVLIDNYTKSGFDKLHEVAFNYYRKGIDQLAEQPEQGKVAILNALMSLQELNEEQVNSMAISIFMQGRVSELIGLFSNADRSTKKQLMTTLSAIDITNLNKYKAAFE
ncbi:MAG: hypothetical protein RL188_291 [Bacteroidota bacterium]|jgi:hypothetical protein